MLASIITADAVNHVYSFRNIYYVPSLRQALGLQWWKKCIDLTFYWWETNNKQEYTSQKEIK